jgi:hypothetical protein
MFGPQCISAEVGPGWVGLVERCLAVLREHGCKVTQIKQKFAGLRVYWDYPDHIDAALAEWRKSLPRPGSSEKRPPRPFDEEVERIYAAVQPVLSQAEADSFRTCESCGKDLGKPGGPKCGWTSCEECGVKRGR